MKSLEEQFRKQNQRLEAQLEEALAERDMIHKSAIDTDTPADKTLKLLDNIMRGQEVRKLFPRLGGNVFKNSSCQSRFSSI